MSALIIKKKWHFVDRLQVDKTSSWSSNDFEFCHWWLLCTLNIHENELIIDHVHKSRAMNYLFPESRRYFRSRIMGNKLIRSRITVTKNRRSWFTVHKSSPFSTLFPHLYCSLFNRRVPPLHSLPTPSARECSNKTQASFGCFFFFLTKIENCFSHF